MLKIFVAGHNGMVGSAICRELLNYENVKLLVEDRKRLDLFNAKEVLGYFEKNQPDYVYLAAAKVGGIYANNNLPASFINDNIQIQTNIINSSHATNVKKLLFLGSSCIYPKFSEQPIKEEYLLTGKLESTNEPYAIAKISGIKMCESFNRQFKTDFRSVMPTNLYGPNDNFNLKNSHVIPALIRRFHEAKINREKFVKVWGSGKPSREFLHVHDMASACVHIMNTPKEKFYSVVKDPLCSHVNIGTSQDCTIEELSMIISVIVGFEGNIIFDNEMPEGPPKKLLCVRKLHKLGWKHSINLKNGLAQTYEWFKENFNSLRDD